MIEAVKRIVLIDGKMDAKRGRMDVKKTDMLLETLL